MDIASVAVGLVFTAVAAYSIWVALLIARSNYYSRGQKAAQIAVALLVPLVGPILCHSLVRSHTARSDKRDPQFTPNRRDDVATGPHIRASDDA